MSVGVQVRQLVRTVQPFHAMGFKNHRAVPLGAAPGLKVLEGCARLLLQTVMLEGYASGLEVRVEVRPGCRTTQLCSGFTNYHALLLCQPSCSTSEQLEGRWQAK